MNKFLNATQLHGGVETLHTYETGVENAAPSCPFDGKMRRLKGFILIFNSI